jgi:thiamine biosynthesis lipoprotein
MWLSRKPTSRLYREPTSELEAGSSGANSSLVKLGPSPAPAAATPNLTTFRALNTTIRVAGTEQDLVPWFETVEETLSRFRPDSALQQLNAIPERWVIVPPFLYEAINLALKAAALTEGAYDPTILDGLEAAGYRRSFELGPTEATSPVPAGRWNEIRLAPEASAVWIPAGVRLDLGGIGKGLAVDRAMDLVPGAPRLLINAGGDLRIRTAPGDPPCLVDIDDPRDANGVVATLALQRGAVATSMTTGRAWGKGLHHIIDPWTGRPSDSGVIAATVISGRAWRAEVLAKAAIILGPERGLRLLATNHAPGLLMMSDGKVIRTPDLEGYLDAST